MYYNTALWGSDRTHPTRVPPVGATVCVSESGAGQEGWAGQDGTVDGPTRER
jgi:hypothetical protein